jgi:hypothetical protein
MYLPIYSECDSKDRDLNIYCLEKFEFHNCNGLSSGTKFQGRDWQYLKYKIKGISKNKRTIIHRINIKFILKYT